MGDLVKTTKPHHFLFAVILIVLTGVDARAATVYEQLPGSGSLSMLISSTLNNYGESPGYTSADDFYLASDALITDIQWWGESNSGGNDFRFTFYTDNQGVPGTALLTTAGSLIMTASMPGSPYDPVNFYMSTLASPFNAVAGTTYWLSIFNQAPDASWVWLTANIPGNGRVQAENPGPPWIYESPIPQSDLAFRLANISQVPLPSTLWLLASGMLALGWGRTKIRR